MHDKHDDDDDYYYSNSNNSVDDDDDDDDNDDDGLADVDGGSLRHPAPFPRVPTSATSRPSIHSCKNTNGTLFDPRKT